MKSTGSRSKTLLVGAAILLFTVTLLPLVSSEALCTLTPGFNQDINKEAIDQDIEINIFGSVYMMQHKPFGMTSGVYGNFVNTGQDQLSIDIGYEIKTYSTIPLQMKEVLLENATLPAGSLGEMTFGTNFGTGIIVFKIILDGCGESEGFYKEKTAYGLCCKYYAFIFMQTY